VLQPKGLPDVTANSDQAKQTISAARELGILAEEASCLRLVSIEKPLATRDFILGVLDKRVSSATDIEPDYAPFYSYLLTSTNQELKQRSGEEWVIKFNQDCPRFARTDNQFNKTKYTGLNRWYSYCGHGWEDSSGTFQPNPYSRVKRSLAAIFGQEHKLSADDFMVSLALHCPELDGGSIFMSTSPQYDPRAKQLTLGVSHALVDLHLDNLIKLDCPVDNRGWSIEAAHPPTDGNLMRSSRIDNVEIVR
jgi:hypothetical protein